MNEIGKEIYAIVERVYPICRSITGDGVRETLKILKEYCEELTIHEVPSGTQAFDWTVPKEWNITDAYIEDKEGNRIVDFKKNNLHVMGYSIPVDKWMEWDELKEHIYTLPEQPDVIPYVTSYYRERFGFCMAETKKKQIKDGRYHVVVDSSLKDGFLTYGEIIFLGKSKEEILFTTYTCHPSLANNECSGPALAIVLADYIKKMKDRKYTYRFIFGPETIGALVYLSRHLNELKQNVIAGFNLTCVGDDRNYSMVESRYGDTLADKVLKNTLRHQVGRYQCRTYLQRGSDERQYCAPGVDLPYVSFCRTKYGEYPEYHTSADDLTVVTPEGLMGSYEILTQCIMALEYNEYYQVSCIGEPQLGKRGLYPTLSRTSSVSLDTWQMRNLLAYADGKNDLIDISNRIYYPVKNLIPMVERLLEEEILCPI